MLSGNTVFGYRKPITHYQFLTRDPTQPPAKFGVVVPADLWAFETMRRGPLPQTLPPRVTQLTHRPLEPLLLVIRKHVTTVVNVHPKRHLHKPHQTQHPTGRKRKKPNPPRISPHAPTLHPSPSPCFKTQLHRVRRCQGKQHHQSRIEVPGHQEISIRQRRTSARTTAKRARQTRHVPKTTQRHVAQGQNQRRAQQGQRPTQRQRGTPLALWRTEQAAGTADVSHV